MKKIRALSENYYILILYSKISDIWILVNYPSNKGYSLLRGFLFKFFSNGNTLQKRLIHSFGRDIHHSYTLSRVHLVHSSSTIRTPCSAFQNTLYNGDSHFSVQTLKEFISSKTRSWPNSFTINGVKILLFKTRIAPWKTIFFTWKSKCRISNFLNSI